MGLPSKAPRSWAWETKERQCESRERDLCASWAHQAECRASEPALPSSPGLWNGRTCLSSCISSPAGGLGDDLGGRSWGLRYLEEKEASEKKHLLSTPPLHA